MQITDLHLGETYEKDSQTDSMIKMIVEKEEIDFIAVTGDLVSGQMDEHLGRDFWFRKIQPLENTFKDIEVPWGFVPGYYDYIADHSGSGLEIYNQAIRIARNVVEMGSSAKDFQYNNKTTQHMLTYNVPIYAADLKTEVSKIWFFENGKWECMKEIGRDCIRRT